MEPADSEVFARRLRCAMKGAGLRQSDLVRLAPQHGGRLGKSQVSQYVSGKTMPRPGAAALLASVLGVDAGWLTGAAAGAQDSGSAPGAQAAPPGPGGPPPTGSSPAPSNESGTPSLSAHASQKGTSMPFIKKSSKLHNVQYDVRGPVVERAHQMEAAGTTVLKLNIGNPAPFGFRTPDEVVYDMAEQLTDTEGYSPSKGLFSARKAIMQYAQLKGIPDVTMDDVYTGNGVSELINMVLTALLEDGDEVLIPSPDYPLWTACANLAGGRAVHYVCDEQADWFPDMDDLRSKVTDRTRAIVVINPNNPTGANYPREVLEEIVEVARANNLVILSDEIYDRLLMDGLTHTSIASLAPDVFCITMSGLSKSHMVAGYRVGWMVLSGNKRGARDYIEGLNLLSNMRLCSNVPGQSIVQTALGGQQRGQSHLVPGGRIYEQREYIYNALNSIPGVSVVKPRAAFYIFPRLDPQRFGIVDDQQFALDLLEEKKVLVVQGTGFNWTAPDHFRIVYLPRIEVLREAMDKLADFLSHYRQ